MLVLQVVQLVLAGNKILIISLLASTAAPVSRVVPGVPRGNTVVMEG